MKKNNMKHIGYAICFLLIAIGVFMAVNSNASSNGTSADEVETPGDSLKESIRHYPALETVIIPDSVAQQTKEYIGFTISFNKDNRTPNYVAWELLGDETEGETGRSNKFWTDADIEGCPDTRDYTRSGYDRGHMCPSADQKWNPQAMEDCFVMANICPQLHALNNGAWKTLENKERQWAKRDSAVMIVAGPIYNPMDTVRIGNAGVRVPGAFFKVLLAPYLDAPRGIGFIYPNMASPGNMQDYAMSIDEVERITGYDFFPSLPDDIENKVESTFSFKEWNSSRKQ